MSKFQRVCSPRRHMLSQLPHQPAQTGTFGPLLLHRSYLSSARAARRHRWRYSACGGRTPSCSWWSWNSGTGTGPAASRTGKRWRERSWTEAVPTRPERTNSRSHQPAGLHDVSTPTLLLFRDRLQTGLTTQWTAFLGLQVKVAAFLYVQLWLKVQWMQSAGRRAHRPPLGHAAR